MTPNNTIIQSALKPVHQGLLLDIGNLRPEIARSWQCCRNLSVHPIRPFSRGCIWRCNCLALSFALHNEFDMTHTRFVTLHK